MIKKLWFSCINYISIILHPICKLLGKGQVRILMYHRVCDISKGTDLIVTPAAFTQQMAFLSQNRFNVITLEDYINYRGKNKKPPSKLIILTFDDGYADNYTNAQPILEKYNFNATFFIVTDYIDSERIFQWLKLDKDLFLHSQRNKRFWLPLTSQNILEMNARGATFGSHTKTHPVLVDIEESMAVAELKDSREHLEKILGKPVRCFSYPYSSVSERIKGLVKAAGYKTAVAGTFPNTLKSDFFELRRIEIKGQDSLAEFIRKVEGAYDWYYCLLFAVKIVRLFLSPGRGRSYGKRIDL